MSASHTHAHAVCTRTRCMHTHMHASHTNTRVFTGTRMQHTHTHTHIHTQTHTHTHARARTTNPPVYSSSQTPLRSGEEVASSVGFMGSSLSTISLISARLAGSAAPLSPLPTDSCVMRSPLRFSSAGDASIEVAAAVMRRPIGCEREVALCGGAAQRAAAEAGRQLGSTTDEGEKAAAIGTSASANDKATRIRVYFFRLGM